MFHYFEHVKFPLSFNCLVKKKTKKKNEARKCQ